MSDYNLLEMYNPLYDVHLRQYFALPHMQKHLRSVGLLDSSMDVRQPLQSQQAGNGPLPPMSGSGGGADTEMYARHHAMMDMMLKNRDRVLAQLADLQKKLDAVEKVELYRSIKSGVTNVDEWRRSRMSRSLSRPGRASGGPNSSRMRRRLASGERQRHLSNSMTPYGDEDKELVRRIEAERAAGVRTPRSIFERLAASVYRYQYLHKLDDRTLDNYKLSLRKQLQKLERFRELSFGQNSVARHQPTNLPQSWFFRRRSLPSLTASAPANSLQQTLARSLKSIKKGGSGHQIRQGGRSQSPRWKNADGAGGINGSANVRQRSSRPAAAHHARLPPLPRPGRAEPAMDDKRAAGRLPPTAVIRPTRKEKLQPVRKATPPTSIKSEEGREEGSERGSGSALPAVAAVGVAGLAAGALLGVASHHDGEGEVTPPAEQSQSPVDVGEAERDDEEEEHGGGGTETRPSPVPFLEADHPHHGEMEDEGMMEQLSPRPAVGMEKEVEDREKEREVEEHHEELETAIAQEEEEHPVEPHVTEEPAEVVEREDEEPGEQQEEVRAEADSHPDVDRVESPLGTEPEHGLVEGAESGVMEATPRSEEAAKAGEEEGHEAIGEADEEVHPRSERESLKSEVVHGEREPEERAAMEEEEPINVTYAEPLAAEPPAVEQHEPHGDEAEPVADDGDHVQLPYEHEEKQLSPERNVAATGEMEQLEHEDKSEVGNDDAHNQAFSEAHEEDHHSPEPAATHVEHRNALMVDGGGMEPMVQHAFEHELENEPSTPAESEAESVKSQPLDAGAGNDSAANGDHESFKEISLDAADGAAECDAGNNEEVGEDTVKDDEDIHEAAESHRSFNGRASAVEEHSEIPLHPDEDHSGDAGHSTAEREGNGIDGEGSIFENPEHSETPHHAEDEDHSGDAGPTSEREENRMDGAQDSGEDGVFKNSEHVDSDDKDRTIVDDVEEPFELKHHSPLTVREEYQEEENPHDAERNEEYIGSDGAEHHSPVPDQAADETGEVMEELHDKDGDGVERDEVHSVVGNDASRAHAMDEAEGDYHATGDDYEGGSIKHQTSPVAIPRSPSYAEAVAAARSPSSIASQHDNGNSIEQDHDGGVLADASIEPEALQHEQGLDKEVGEEEKGKERLNGLAESNGHHHFDDAGDEAEKEEGEEGDERTSLLSTHDKPIHSPPNGEKEEHVDDEEEQETSENGSVITYREEHDGREESEKRKSLGELKRANRNSVGNAEETGEV